MYIACKYLSSGSVRLVLIASTAEEPEPRDEIRWQLPLSLFHLSSPWRYFPRRLLVSNINLATCCSTQRRSDMNVLCGQKL
jgi:hypothetical protein